MSAPPSDSETFAPIVAVKAPSQSEQRRAARLIADLIACGLLAFLPRQASAQPTADKKSEESRPAQPADAREPEEAEEEDAVELSEWRGGNSDFTGWVNFTVGGASVQGNEAAFQRRHGIAYGLSGGVSEFYWETFVGENGTVRLGGKAVGGSEDFDVHIGYENPDKGYFRAGASQSRLWRDATGGRYAPTGAGFPHSDSTLYLDRRKIWIEGGLTLPDKPTIGIRYEHHERFGDTDSTIWGSTPAAADRGVSAAFRGIDETRDIVTLNAAHTLGNTTLGAGTRYQYFQSDNTLNFQRDAGALTEDFTTQKESVDSDLFSFHIHSLTPLRTNLNFSTAYSFTTVDTGVTGNRILGTGYDPVFDPSIVRFPGFINLHGGSRLNQQVAAVNFHYQPTRTVSIVPSLRVESTGVNNDVYHTATPSAAGDRNINGGQDYLDFSERLEARYIGLKNWVLYARGDWDQGDGDLQERQTTLATGTIQLQRDTDFQRFGQKYTLGANWYPARKLNLAGHYYYKRRDNDYDHLIDTTGNAGVIRHPAYLTRQEFDTHDFNVRVTVRPSPTIVSVSRYDFQLSSIETGANGLPEIQSADLDTHVFSQSLSWAPLSRLYLQGMLTYVYDVTTTPANSGASAAIVPESQNSFWNVGGNLGCALDARTDLQLEYLYQLADNFIDNSASSLPYGAGFEEHRITATVNRRLSENTHLVLEYGFVDFTETTTGGAGDHLAHLFSSTLRRRF